MKPVKFIPRTKVKEMIKANYYAVFYDTSTHAPYALNFPQVVNASEFSPFIAYGNIPVPKTNEVSDSVEGIWQGLKVIRKKTDFSYFHGKGRKRQGKPKGHQYGKKVISYVQARKKIFIPTYTHMVFNCVPVESLQRIHDQSIRGIEQYFFDVDDNQNVGNVKSPLAHSSILVDIINNHFLEKRKNPKYMKLKRMVKEAFEYIDNRQYGIAKEKFENLLQIRDNEQYGFDKEKFKDILQIGDNFYSRLGLGICCFHEFLDNKDEFKINLTMRHLERAHYSFNGDYFSHLLLAQCYAIKFHASKDPSFREKALEHYELSLDRVSRSHDVNSALFETRIKELIFQIQNPISSMHINN